MNIPTPTPSPSQLAELAETPTPRTDDLAARMAARPLVYGGTVVWDLCKQMEGDLTQLRAENEKLKKDYYDVADAICKESTGPEDLCEQARSLRQQLTHLKAELERANGLLKSAAASLEDLGASKTESSTSPDACLQGIIEHLNPKKTP